MASVAETKPIPVRLGDDVIARLDAAAARIGSNRAAVMRMLLTTWLDDFEQNGKASLPPNWEQIMADLDGRTANVTPMPQAPTRQLTGHKAGSKATKVDILAAAGSPILAEVEEWNDANDLVRVRICGMSMSPEFNDGDVIEMKHRRASRNPYMKKGLIYLIGYDDGYAVKRYNKRDARPEEVGEEWAPGGKVQVLESINPAYGEIIIKQELEWFAWLATPPSR